ncbi:MAG: DciA family protein [Pseudomonadota bacterium]
MTEKRLSELLSGDDLLTQLADQAQAHDRQQSALLAILPAEMRAEVAAAGFGDGILTLTTASAGWASRLRYAEPDLCRRYVAAGFDVRSIAVRVRPTAADQA